MSLYQTLYFMSLVGGMAGLFSWVLVALVSMLLVNNPILSDLVTATILGSFIGGLTVAFSDRWSGNRVLPRWVISGILIGMVAGLSAGLIQIPITNNLGEQLPILTRLIAWMLAGSFIGLGLGLRWVGVNRARVAHAFAGGLFGGAIGGTIFAGLGASVPDLSQALGFVMVGVGICFGVTLAPILLRDGVLQFVSSGDARAQSKFGRTHKEWEIQQGDSYVIGSQSQDLSRSRYRPEIDIFIPDAGIAPRHAILLGKSGRFFLARHPNAEDHASMAQFQLRVRGKTVVTSQELRDADDILVGRTALKFVTRKEK
jgi:MFS family permease